MINQSEVVGTLNNLKKNEISLQPLNNLVVLLMSLSFVRIFLCYTFFDLTIGLYTIIFSAMEAIISFIAVISVMNRFKQSIQIAWGLLILSIAASYFTHMSGLEYIFNTFTFINILAVLPFIKIKFITVKRWIILFGIFSLLIALFATKFENDSISLIKINTNGSSFILFLMEFLLLACAKVEKRSNRFVYFVAFVIVVVFQLMFTGRSSLIGTVMLILYVCFSNKLNKMKSKTVKRLVLGLSFFSFIFVYVYTVPLFNAIGHGNLYLFGKDIFTGRQMIWADAFEQLSGHWIFGIGNTLSSIPINGDTSGVTNLHNQMMGYVTCFGLIVAVIYAILISLLAARISSTSKSKYCVACIIALVVMAYFDTVLYSSDNMAFIPIVLIILHLCDKEIDKKGII